MPILTSIFSNGLVQPPTSHGVIGVTDDISGKLEEFPSLDTEEWRLDQSTMAA